MKKIFSSIAVSALLFAITVSCEKENEESVSNSITITGDVTVGEKKFTNPTFNLGEPNEHQGYTVTFIEKNIYNGIIIEPVENIDLGNNLVLYYEMGIYIYQSGMGTMNCYVSIYNTQIGKKVSDFYVSSQDAKVNITKIGDVGEYIEGNYEGDFYVPTGDFYVSTKAELPSYQIKGKFKVKRITQPTPVK